MILENGKISVSDYFGGGCPVCGEARYLNVYKAHWLVCHAHRKRHWFGEDLLDSWRDENEEVWALNSKLLSGYEEVTFLPEGEWSADPTTNRKNC